MSRTMRLRLGGGSTALVVVIVMAFAASGSVLDPARLGQVVPVPAGGSGPGDGDPRAVGPATARDTVSLDGGPAVEGPASDVPDTRLSGGLLQGARIERLRQRAAGLDRSGPGPGAEGVAGGGSSPAAAVIGPGPLEPVGDLPVGVHPATRSGPTGVTPTVRPPDPLTPASLSPAVAPADLAAYPELGWGDEGPHVTVLQARLAGLGFRATETDGYFGGGTWSAVLAFQKFEGLERTGSVTADVWQRLYQPQGWLPPRQRTTAPKVEVDLDRQVLFVLNADHPGHVVILNTSTGGGYYYTNKDGSTDYAYTPEGNYNVYRRYDGLEVAPLGTLYRPMYFVGGWAVHGSPSVPEYPASHGCVRLSNDDADWLWDRAPDDMGVTVRATMDPNVLGPQAWEEWVGAIAEAPTVTAA